MQARLAAILVTVASSANAQIQQGTAPDVGQEATVPIGGEMLSEFRYKTLPGILLKSDLHLTGFVMGQSVDLRSGTGLAIIREKKLKACQTHTSVGWDVCVLDMDDDGKIERAALNSLSGAKDVVPPVAYEKGAVRVNVEPRLGEGDDFKRVLVFTGATADALTVSYREFVNDLARPAFTEALSVPLTRVYPQRVALKDHVFELEALDGMGLRYTLIK